MSDKFDIILIGLGASALQFAWLIKDLHFFSKKTILFIDPQPDYHKSWCFWHSGVHPCDHFVTHRWNRLKFSYQDFSKAEQLASYQYRYIPASSMFDWFFSEGLPNHANWHYLKDKVITHVQHENDYVIKTPDQVIHSNVILDARLEKENLLSPHLWQHFHGWFVEFDKPILDNTTATLMDFSLTSTSEFPVFFYLLPFSSQSCLIEATVFSFEVWPLHRYDSFILDYIARNFDNAKYSISQVETGKIPMSFIQQESNHTPNYFKIGGAAGMIKPTTGYTFNRITSHIQSVIQALQTGVKPTSVEKNRYTFYDELLLKIIAQNPGVVSKIFYHLFKGNSIQQILTFLDESMALQQDLRLLAKLPYTPFIKSFLSR